MAPSSPLRVRGNNNIPQQQQQQQHQQPFLDSLTSNSGGGALDSLLSDMTENHLQFEASGYKDASPAVENFYSPSKQQHHFTPMRQKQQQQQLSAIQSPNSPQSSWVPPSPSVDRNKLQQLQAILNYEQEQQQEAEEGEIDFLAEAQAALNSGMMDESFEAEMMSELKSLRDVADSRQQRIFDLEGELADAKAQHEELNGEVDVLRSELASVRDVVSESFRSPETRSVVSGCHSLAFSNSNALRLSASAAAYLTSPNGQLLPPGHTTAIQQFVDEAAEAARRRLQFGGDGHDSCCPALTPRSGGARPAMCEMSTNTEEEDFAAASKQLKMMDDDEEEAKAIAAPAETKTEQPRFAGRRVHAGVGVINLRKMRRMQKNKNRPFLASLRLFLFDILRL